uniref:Integrase, catalytic region, zinc finger, CCHC-type, peptidase aspartic, catalytic n=1 Tax=Tanacetum cinerariifolium TaxID=118510 RepID=A0A6L2NN64_TANCI|nr:hypothetical protein [Tanacetum cinerariifolium]
MGTFTQRCCGSLYPKMLWEPLPKDVVGASTQRCCGSLYRKMWWEPHGKWRVNLGEIAKFTWSRDQVYLEWLPRVFLGVQGGDGGGRVLARQDKMSRDVITVGLTMRISLSYRCEYSQWRERFMNYLEEQTDGEAMINSIHNRDQPLPVIAQVSLDGTVQNSPPTLKDLKFWTAEEKKTQKINRLARFLLIQGLPNDIYSLIDSNKTAKDLWDALERQMHGSEYAEQDRKATILYEYKTFKASEGEQLLDTYLRYLQLINV